MKLFLTLFTVLLFLISTPSLSEECSNGGPYSVDSETLLLLHLDGDLLGEQGEVPLTYRGTFWPGKFGLALDSGEREETIAPVYNAEGNWNTAEGTVEFWFKPDWDKWMSDDEDLHRLFSTYSSVTSVSYISAFATMTYVGFGDADNFDSCGAIGTSINWSDQEWHHILGSWSDYGRRVELWVDGVLIGEDVADSGDCLNGMGTPDRISLNVAPFDFDWAPNGLTDEFRISSVDRCVTEFPPTVPRFKCIGFKPPMEDYPVTINGGRPALPLRATLEFEDESPVTDMHITKPPIVVVYPDPAEDAEAMDITGDVTPSITPDVGNEFLFTPRGVWQFILGLENYSASGTYTVRMESGDKSEYDFDEECITEFIVP